MRTTNEQTIRKPMPRWMLLVGGIVAVFLGGILLWAPAKTRAETWIVLVVILGAYWLVTGILEIISIFHNQRQWGWKLFVGVISIFAGGYILIYPSAAAIVLPRAIVLALGIWGLIQGFILLGLAFSGAGLGAGILGGLAIFLGIVLVINYASPSVGSALIWAGGALALAGGIFMIVQSFIAREPLYSGT